MGFRPFCANLAREHEVTGWVCNDGEGVLLEVQGDPTALDAFVRAIVVQPPPLARIERIEPAPCAVRPRERHFVILDSRAADAPSTIVPADACTCGDCLDELFDPADRRYRYPFVNCTHCGPRWTITTRLPYDRPFTSMAGFAMCAECAGEYGAPADRRYHAQPNACPRCGPRLDLLDARGVRVECEDAIAEAARRLRAGEVLAVKGVGGFHLVCDAARAQTLARLRRSKLRASKPFAVMCLNAASAALWGEIDAPARGLLESTARPIVLVPKRKRADRELAQVAPGTGEIGVMLPYAPLHWLLFHELLGRPAGRPWRDAANELVLVATSANPGGEPLVIGNDEALARLGGLADAYLVHDRPIVARCDDSVVRAGQAAPGVPAAPSARPGQFVRRGRGYVPAPIALPGVPRDAPAQLACGAWLKNTVCITRGNEAFLSPHIGDLGSAASCAALEEAVERLTEFLAVVPTRVQHDLHPDFFSSRFALDYARARGIEALAVQHHHAHIAAVCAEHGAHGAVLGIALDGVGLGTDGTAWGGELLRVEGAAFERVASFVPLALPGGDAAARAPWRVAAAALHALGRGDEIAARFAAHAAAPTVSQMLARDLHCPRTSSAGRLFDAAAALLGLTELNRHEAEAAMALEATAFAHGEGEDCGAWTVDARGNLDLLPLLDRLADVGAQAPRTERVRAAAAFHQTLAAAVARWAARHARAQGLATVALAGGCWLNRLLRQGVVARLARAGFVVLEAQAAPPNDGGIALGQAWIGTKGS